MSAPLHLTKREAAEAVADAEYNLDMGGDRMDVMKQFRTEQPHVPFQRIMAAGNAHMKAGRGSIGDGIMLFISNYK